MSEPAQARSKDSRYRDRRADERYEINIPGGCLNYRGAKYPCQIIDVSLSGCCIRTEAHFSPGNLANVEIVLPLLGMVLRMVGKTQWLTRDNLIGIRFFHASARSKNQLAGLLTCLVDQDATDEVKAAVVAQAQSGRTDLNVEFVEPLPKIIKPVPVPAKVQEPSTNVIQDEKSVFSNKGAAPHLEGEDWPAILRFTKDNSHQSGIITNLNQEGCCLQTLAHCNAGNHTRVEVDFQMRGLHFLLAGVIENLRNMNFAEIRFLDMSSRKRQELAEVIEELRQEANKQPDE